MTKTSNLKQYDLEDRTLLFAKEVRTFLSKVPTKITNMDDVKQLIRSSGSVGANYIEANEALSKKDFVHRIKICRKEAKETIYWLKLLSVEGKTVEDQRQKLQLESTELMKIFGSILRNSK